jgi:hypothetical protein
MIALPARATLPSLALASAVALIGHGPAAEASTVEAPICDYCSRVTDIVTDNGDGSWTYEFTVYNDSPAVSEGPTLVIVDWELPYFDDSGITNVQSAYGWTWAIETIGVENPATGWSGVANWQQPGDPWYPGPDSPFTTATQVLHWFTLDGNNSGIRPAGFEGGGSFVGSASGFSFTAPFPATAAPYQASWADLVIQTGDPAFPLGTGAVPASPNAIVPLPAPLALLGAALAGLVGLQRRRAS